MSNPEYERREARPNSYVQTRLEKLNEERRRFIDDAKIEISERRRSISETNQQVERIKEEAARKIKALEDEAARKVSILEGAKRADQAIIDELQGHIDMEISVQESAIERIQQLGGVAVRREESLLREPLRTEYDDNSFGLNDPGVRELLQDVGLEDTSAPQPPHLRVVPPIITTASEAIHAAVGEQLDDEDDDVDSFVKNRADQTGPLPMQTSRSRWGRRQ